MQTLLEAKDLTYVYGQGTPFMKTSVSDVSFYARGKEITGIIGHTGSGKSTLVQMLNGILTPKTGSVSLNGENIYKSKKTLYDARFKIGLVFQYPEYQLFDETVRRDIAFGPSNMGLSKEETERRTLEAIKFVGFPEELLDASPFELSGGQRRRAAIAGVLVMYPTVLVLDEPASGLDPLGKKQIFEGLDSYRKITGAAIIIISHSMDDMAKYADNILVMENGKAKMFGSVSEVFSRADELVASGLNIPSAARVILKLQEKGYDLPSGILSASDAADAIIDLINNRKDMKNND